MKRIIVCFLVIILCTPGIIRAEEDDKPIYDPKFLPEIINTDSLVKPPPARVTPRAAGIAPYGIKQDFGSWLVSKIFSLSGTSNQEQLTINTVSDVREGNMLETWMVRIMSHIVQKNFLKLITYEQHLSANHVQCFYDEDGGEDHRPDREIFNPPAFGQHRIRGAAKVLQSQFVPSVQLPTDQLNLFLTEPNQLVTPQNGLSCGTQLEGTPIRGLGPYNDVFEYYDSDTVQQSADRMCSDAQIAESQACVQANSNLKPGEEPEDCSLTCSDNAHLVYSTYISGSVDTRKRLWRSDDGEKKGATYKFIPASFNLEKEHGVGTQDHEITLLRLFTGGATSQKAIYPDEAGLQEHMDALKCAITSDKYQKSKSDNQKCIFPTGGEEEEACNSTELPDLSGANGSCSLCNASLPKTMVDIFNKAASTYNVPASILYSIFVSEGGADRWDWTEESVKAASVCGGEVPDCDANASGTGARGPFGFLATGSSGNYQWSPDFAESSKTVDPSRTEFSPCNLLDSAFAAAAKLAKESGGSGAYPPPAACWGHPFYTSAVGPATSCNWTEERISTSMRQYVGYCTETVYQGPGGSSGAQTADNNHWKRAYNFYASYSCR